jgi:tungstate transport system substrate-binding protein
MNRLSILTVLVLGAILALSFSPKQRKQVDLSNDQQRQLISTITGVHSQEVPSDAAGPSPTVRLATVTTIKDGGLLGDLLADFEQQFGYRVETYIGNDIYNQARAGKADLVFSHLGHRDTQSFMADRLGQWPRTVLFNQIALIIPTSDPANIRGVSDPVEAFRRIAETESPFVVHDSEGLTYLVDTLWHAAGRPPKGDWYIDVGLRQEQAMKMASEKGAYTVWGVTPFLVSQQKNGFDLQPLIFSDPLFQRIMVSIVVNPEHFPDANIEGAMAFQQYLLAPATQARIRAFRYPSIDQPIFWPAGRNNASDLLPR